VSILILPFLQVFLKSSLCNYSARESSIHLVHQVRSEYIFSQEGNTRKRTQSTEKLDGISPGDVRIYKLGWPWKIFARCLKLAQQYVRSSIGSPWKTSSNAILLSLFPSNPCPYVWAWLSQIFLAENIQASANISACSFTGHLHNVEKNIPQSKEPNPFFIPVSYLCKVGWHRRNLDAISRTRVAMQIRPDNVSFVYRESDERNKQIQVRIAISRICAGTVAKKPDWTFVFEVYESVWA